MVKTFRIQVNTKGRTDIVDITGGVSEAVSRSGMANGLATVFVPGSTAGVSTVEFEPGLVHDLKEAWERLVPQAMQYQHDQAWGDGNGYSHVRSAMLGPSLTVPFAERRLTLGTWQQIVLVDFDNRPRSREVVIQLVGE